MLAMLLLCCWWSLLRLVFFTSRFPCCVLSYFSVVFVVEHNWQIQITRVSWVGQSTSFSCSFSMLLLLPLRWGQASLLEITRPRCNYHSCAPNCHPCACWMLMLLLSLILFFMSMSVLLLLLFLVLFFSFLFLLLCSCYSVIVLFDVVFVVVVVTSLKVTRPCGT